MNKTPDTFRTKKLVDMLNLFDTMAFEKIRLAQTLHQSQHTNLAKIKEIEAQTIRELIKELRHEFHIPLDLCEELLKEKNR